MTSETISIREKAIVGARAINRTMVSYIECTFATINGPTGLFNADELAAMAELAGVATVAAARFAKLAELISSNHPPQGPNLNPSEN
jgi:hypothetical protein